MESILGKRWQIQSTQKNKEILGTNEVLDILLSNRNLKTKKAKSDFLDPKKPEDISLTELEISSSDLKKAVIRIKKAIKSQEKVIIYGDYDADGICATAILWEALHSLGVDALPYLPERFSEGYGLNSESIKSLKEKYPNLGLVITVDNGVTAIRGVKSAKGLGIDVIVTDHHQKGKKEPPAHSIIHTQATSGAGIAWFLARELGVKNALELAAIGIISDQIPLIGINRLLVKYGLVQLSRTKRPGLLAMYEEAGIRGAVGPYAVGFLIAPRLNAMGRMYHAIDSLRLVCTKSAIRAKELSQLLGKTNRERQQTVEDSILTARESAKNLPRDKFILIASETYHEGIIGLIAGKLAEEFYRPVIVVAKGEKISKASARSIPGVSIIEIIRKMDTMLVSGGGHEMAAGFSIRTADLEKFESELSLLSKDYLTREILKKVLKIDLELKFSQINHTLYRSIIQLEPFGIGNPAPIFLTKQIQIVDSRLIGEDKRHLKFKLSQNEKEVTAVAFGMGEYYSKLSSGTLIDMVYSIEENRWNGNIELQLKIKDIKV